MAMAANAGTVFVLNGVNQRRLRGSVDDDIVRGTVAKPWVWNGRRGIIQLRGGDDRIKGGRYVRLNGETSLGKGGDTVEAHDFIALLAVDQFNGTLSTGAGGDAITVSAGSLDVGEDSRVELGDGDDRIEAAAASLLGGSIDTGRGADRCLLGKGDLAISLGSLVMGEGRDRLIAWGGLRLRDGSASLGGGDDLIDVRRGGLDHWDSPANSLDLGAGDDRMIGFASLPEQGSSAEPGAGLRGGKGRDTLVLTTGVYAVGAGRISTADILLPVRGINGLAGLNGGSFRYAPGTLTVDAAGVASFVPEV